MIYYGANDGMLHAVNGGFFDEKNDRFWKAQELSSEGYVTRTDSGPGLGTEMWAYVPYNLQPHMKCLTDLDYNEHHKYFVDKEPRIFDMQIDRNPIPFSVGRVCPRFCETRCRRILIDEPVSINHLKRFVADWCMEHEIDLKIPKDRPTGKRIAVIGGGPAGLTAAWFLTKKGHSVTIFEAAPKLGGALRYGFPDYKIPKDIVDYEVNAVLRMGINVQQSQKWGTDFTLQDLKDSGFDATFIAIGATVDVPFDVPCTDKDNVFTAVDFLRQINEGRKLDRSHCKK